MPGLARINIVGFEARIYAPFEAKDIIKTMPDRRWSGADKCWIIPAPDVPQLVAALETEGFRSVVTGAEQPPPKTSKQRQATTWATTLFEALTGRPDLADRVFKKLSSVLHPDVGGDQQLMQELNTARDVATGKARR